MNVAYCIFEYNATIKYFSLPILIKVDPALKTWNPYAMLLKFQPNFIKFPRNSIYAAVSLRIHRVLCETCSFKELFHSLPIVGLLTKDKEIGNVSIKTFTIESESKHALLQHHWNHNFFSTSQYRWPWLIPKNFQSVDFVDFGRNFPSAGGFDFKFPPHYHSLPCNATRHHVQPHLHNLNL